MDTTLLIIVLAAACLGALAAGVAVFIAVRPRRGGSGATPEGEIAGRVAQMADAQAAAQTQFSERLQVQERALTKLLDERLTHVTNRVNETLERNNVKQRTALDSLAERLIKIDAAQKNIAELSTQVVGLQDILANKQARGAFGEVQLQNLVETVLPPSAYSFQATIGDNKRVDCLLELPNPPGAIAIDAKFPLESYRAMNDARDEAARSQAARRFGTDVMKHIRDIAEKYIVPGETADAALMFLPSEAVYAELHANFGDVIDKSYRAKVFIVSPTTLWATLNTIRAVLKDVHMKEAAGVIQAEVLRMLDDVGRLDERVGKLQRHFDQSTEDIRQIRISAEKVSNRGEKIHDMQLEDHSDENADSGMVENIAASPPLQSTGD